ncbi:hypothetical protein D6C82_02806 [Aureobasidium pullulans]|nr:hypothetical protein D6C82_02806 [Aureobasidium pullulans]
MSLRRLPLLFFFKNQMSPKHNHKAHNTMTLLTEYPRAVSATHPQDKPKSCTFILVSNQWMHQQKINTKLGLKIAPGEKVVYLLSFSRHEHAFQVTNPSRANLGIISLVSAFCKEGISHDTTAVGPDDKLSFTLPLSQVHDRCSEDNCGLVLPELRKEDASLSVTLNIMTLGKAIQLYDWKREEFDVASGNGKAFGEGLAARMLTKELALVRGMSPSLLDLRPTRLSRSDCRTKSETMALAVSPTSLATCKLRPIIPCLRNSWYGLIFSFRDLPQGYTLWWKARRGNPTNQQGQVQVLSMSTDTLHTQQDTQRSPIRQGFKKNIETTIKLHSIKTHDHRLPRASCCVLVCVNFSCASSCPRSS